jgi:hypothetical protein
VPSNDIGRTGGDELAGHGERDRPGHRDSKSNSGCLGPNFVVVYQDADPVNPSKPRVDGAEPTQAALGLAATTLVGLIATASV